MERKVSPAALAKKAFVRDRNRLAPIKFDFEVMPKHASFSPPQTFSFTKNYNETLAFLMDFQRKFFEGKKKRLPNGKWGWHYANLSAIRSIDAGAGLVLAAEIDRFAAKWGTPAGVRDDLWQPDVHDYFEETGLFELLKIRPRVETASAPSSGRRTLKFSKGGALTGKNALQLLDGLEELTGKAISSRPLAYVAIAEALANVSHAYPVGFVNWPYSGTREWWASGFFEPSTNRIGLQLYDHGAGIPATLPKQTDFPAMLQFFDPERTDGGLIAAALKYGRTSTGKDGRGKGLGEMAQWIERTGSGFLRILSRGGQVTYRPGGDVEKRNNDVPFRGTLVEWEVMLDA